MLPERFSPLPLALTLLAVIFGAELLFMLSLESIFPAGTPHWQVAIADATLITIAASIWIWWLFMRPLGLALASEAARAKAVLDTAAEGIVTIDRHGNVESFNRAAERMFGYAAGEVVGQNVRMLMPEPHRSAHDGYIGRYLRTGEARAIGQIRELTARRKDGSEFPVELNLTEIRVGGERLFTGILRDISERKQAQAKIEALAHYDSLTGLPNRALFYERLGQAVGLAERNRHSLALLFLDLDRFKAVNDTLGHDAGDDLLKEVAARLRSQVRGSDTAARIGGDEFLVLLSTAASREGAAVVARKIVGALCAPFHLGAQKHKALIGASIGIAIYPDDAREPDALVKAADAAMYEAKQTRNGYRFSGASGGESRSDDAISESGLEAAT